jgi:hypothetical protein
VARAYKAHKPRNPAQLREEYTTVVWHTAQSSHLQAYDYEPESQTLTVAVVDGPTYQYTGVPQDGADMLERNGGSGRYFAAAIRS